MRITGSSSIMSGRGGERVNDEEVKSGWRNQVYVRRDSAWRQDMRRDSQSEEALQPMFMLAD